MNKSKTCFVISPIGAADSPQRKRADIVLKHIFKHALEPLGYAVVRADEISQPGSITLQVLERVLESDLVIADLTDHNPNVFYELAVRHASQRPVIHVIASDQKIPFDVADLRTVQIDVDLEGADRARQQIIAQAQEIEAGNVGETPVKLAGVLKHLAGGKSDEKVILKQILDGITELRSDFRKDVPHLVMHNKQILQQLRRREQRHSSHEFEPFMESREKKEGAAAIALADKKLQVIRQLEKELETIGDSLYSLDLTTAKLKGDPILMFDVKTKNGISHSVYFEGGASNDRVAKSLFDLIKRSQDQTNSEP